MAIKKDKTSRYQLSDEFSFGPWIQVNELINKKLMFLKKYPNACIWLYSPPPEAFLNRDAHVLFLEHQIEQCAIDLYETVYPEK